MMTILLIFFALHSECGNSTGAVSNVKDDGIPRIPGMKLVWHDEFNKDGKPDRDNWGYENGFVRNRELQWYQPQNAYCKDGKLIIEGKRERSDNPYYYPQSSDWRTNRKYANYSSSSLVTKGLQEWIGPGYYEIRARIDTTSGAWPAIWLLGTKSHWPNCGEIDVMEFYRIDGTPTILANACWGSEEDNHGAWDSQKIPLADFLKEDPGWVRKFHVWGMKWDKKVIRIFIDHELVNTIELDKTNNPDDFNPFVSNQKFYILLNLAIGANGGTPMDAKFPISYVVDYVRVYKVIE